MWCSFCYGDEESIHRACTDEYLTTANQNAIREAHRVSVVKHPKGAAGGRFCRCRAVCNLCCIENTAKKSDIYIYY